jgi:hypothetical protein
MVRPTLFRLILQKNFQGGSPEHFTRDERLALRPILCDFGTRIRPNYVHDVYSRGGLIQ